MAVMELTSESGFNPDGNLDELRRFFAQAERDAANPQSRFSLMSSERLDEIRRFLEALEADDNLFGSEWTRNRLREIEAELAGRCVEDA